MTIRGRKPKPTKEKRLRGNPGHRQLNAHEPAVEPCIPSCPAHLNKYAKAEWKRIARELYGLGLLSQVDRAALAAYCQAYGRWVDVEMKLTKSGYTAIGSTGNNVQHPYVRIANTLRVQLVAFAAEFGMTPSSRSRVQVDPKAADGGLEQKLFGKPVRVSE